MDGLLKFGLVCAGGSLFCFVASGNGDAVVIWFGVAAVIAPLVVIKLRRGMARAEVQAEAPAAGSRHRSYVFASETTSAPKRRRAVVK